MQTSGPRREQLDAMTYYAKFTDEIEARLRANTAATEEAEALWRRRHELPTQ